jgi:hypothetical protein
MMAAENNTQEGLKLGQESLLEGHAEQELGWAAIFPAPPTCLTVFGIDPEHPAGLAAWFQEQQAGEFAFGPPDAGFDGESLADWGAPAEG